MTSTCRGTSPRQRSRSPRRRSSRAPRWCEEWASNPTRTGLLRVLERMGGDVEVEDRRQRAAEPVGGPRRALRRALRGTEVEPTEVPLAIDELPLVALLGAFAEGTTIVRGAEELRHKESDRITTVVEGLRGARRADRGCSRRFRGRGHGRAARRQHRRAPGTIASRCWARWRASPRARAWRCEGFEAAAVSYPGFSSDLAGLRVSRHGAPPDAGATRQAGGSSRADLPPPARARAGRREWCCFALLVRGCSALVGRRRWGGGERGRGRRLSCRAAGGDPAALPRRGLLRGAPGSDELGVLGRRTPEEAARKLARTRGRIRAPGAACDAGAGADRDAGAGGARGRRAAPAASDDATDSPPPARGACDQGAPDAGHTARPGRLRRRGPRAASRTSSQPDVGLALDPEWSVPEGVAAGQRDRVDGRGDGERGRPTTWHASYACAISPRNC